MMQLANLHIKVPVPSDVPSAKSGVEDPLNPKPEP